MKTDTQVRSVFVRLFLAGGNAKPLPLGSNTSYLKRSRPASLASL